LLPSSRHLRVLRSIREQCHSKWPAPWCGYRFYISSHRCPCFFWECQCSSPCAISGLYPGGLRFYPALRLPACTQSSSDCQALHCLAILLPWRR